MTLKVSHGRARVSQEKLHSCKFGSNVMGRKWLAREMRRSAKVSTSFGLATLSVSPWPSWPCLPIPQLKTWPFLVTAKVWLPPHDNCILNGSTDANYPAETNSRILVSALCIQDMPQLCYRRLWVHWNSLLVSDRWVSPRPHPRILSKHTYAARGMIKTVWTLVL